MVELETETIWFSSSQPLKDDEDEENFLFRSCGCKCLSVCYNGTTTAKDLNCSARRIQRRRFRSFAGTTKLQATDKLWWTNQSMLWNENSPDVAEPNFRLHILSWVAATGKPSRTFQNTGTEIQIFCCVGGVWGFRVCGGRSSDRSRYNWLTIRRPRGSLGNSPTPHVVQDQPRPPTASLSPFGQKPHQPLARNRPIERFLFSGSDNLDWRYPALLREVLMNVVNFTKLSGCDGGGWRLEGEAFQWWNHLSAWYLWWW